METRLEVMKKIVLAIQESLAFHDMMPGTDDFRRRYREETSIETAPVVSSNDEEKTLLTQILGGASSCGFHESPPDASGRTGYIIHGGYAQMQAYVNQLKDDMNQLQNTENGPRD